LLERDVRQEVRFIGADRRLLLGAMYGCVPGKSRSMPEAIDSRDLFGGFYRSRSLAVI
jgi:hypothetical protein